MDLEIESKIGRFGVGLLGLELTLRERLWFIGVSFGGLGFGIREMASQSNECLFSGFIGVPGVRHISKVSLGSGRRWKVSRRLFAGQRGGVSIVTL